MRNKGISLIVLVITIIVMIILAAAVILSLNVNNVVNKAQEATLKNELANLKEKVSVVVAKKQLEGQNINYLYKLSDMGILDDKYEPYARIENGQVIILNSAPNNIKEIAERLGLTSDFFTITSGRFTLSNTNGRKIFNYKIYGNGVQGGETVPTVENPIDITSLGENGSISIKLTGKNLLKSKGVPCWGIYMNGGYYNGVLQDDLIQNQVKNSALKFNSDAYYGNNSGYITLKPNTTYIYGISYISDNETDENARIALLIYKSADNVFKGGIERWSRLYKYFN